MKTQNNIDIVNILDVNISRLSMQETLLKIDDYIKEDQFHMIFTPNSEIIMLSRENKDLKLILDDADLLVPDGVGVVLASKINKKSVKEKVAGCEILNNILNIANNKDYKIYFLGGKPNIAKRAIDNTKAKLPNVNFVGFHDGYFKENEEIDIINEINASGADILFVALGAPKEEFWVYKHKDDLKVNVAIGVGGSFDILAGESKRAPKIFIKLGLEWFYRLLKEPWRYKRMLALPKFGLTVLKERIMGVHK